MLNLPCPRRTYGPGSTNRRLNQCYTNTIPTETQEKQRPLNLAFLHRSVAKEKGEQHSPSNTEKYQPQGRSSTPTASRLSMSAHTVPPYEFKKYVKTTLLPPTMRSGNNTRWFLLLGKERKSTPPLTYVYPYPTLYELGWEEQRTHHKTLCLAIHKNNLLLLWQGDSQAL